MVLAATSTMALAAISQIPKCDFGLDLATRDFALIFSGKLPIAGTSGKPPAVGGKREWAWSAPKL